MVKIVVCSDAHADFVTGGVDRYEDVRAAMLQARDAAVEEEADLFLFLGDLADPEDGPRALRAVSLAIEVVCDLAEHEIPSACVAGNHCVIDDGSGRSVLTPLAAMGMSRVRVFDRPDAAFYPGGLHLVALPYPSLANAYDPAAFVRKARAEIEARWASGTKPGPVVVASHLTEIAGVEPGEESVEMSRGRGVPLPLAEIPPDWIITNGHFHRGQTFESAGRKVLIPGSLCRLTHGEEKHAPRFLVLDV